MSSKLRYIYLQCLFFTLPALTHGQLQSTFSPYKFVQTSPNGDFSVGGFPTDVLEVNGQLIILGHGWGGASGINPSTYLSLFSSEGHSELIYDDFDLATWVNQANKGSLHKANETFLFSVDLQSRFIEPSDTFWTAHAIFAVPESGFPYLVDSFYKVDVRDQMGGPYKRVHFVDDSMRYAVSSQVGFASRTRGDHYAFIELDLTNQDTIRTLRRFERRDLPWRATALAEYVRADTLFRVVRDRDTELWPLYFDISDITTGSRLDSHRLDGRIIMEEGLPNPVGIPVYGEGAWFQLSAPYFEDEPGVYYQVPRMHAFDFDGNLRFEREFETYQTYQVNGSVALAFDSLNGSVIAGLQLQQYDGSAQSRTDQFLTVVESIDANSGESLWRTRLSLLDTGVDGPGDRRFYVQDIYPRKGDNGGYIVTGLIRTNERQPELDLPNSYTGMFFLDSVGCFAPGCRQATGLDDSRDIEFVILAGPNPVPAGTPLRISVNAPDQLTSFDYYFVDVTGRTVREGIIDGPLLPTNGLVPGMYQLVISGSKTVPYEHRSYVQTIIVQ